MAAPSAAAEVPALAVLSALALLEMGCRLHGSSVQMSSKNLARNMVLLG